MFLRSIWISCERTVTRSDKRASSTQEAIRYTDDGRLGWATTSPILEQGVHREPAPSLSDYAQGVGHLERDRSIMARALLLYSRRRIFRLLALLCPPPPECRPCAE